MPPPQSDTFVFFGASGDPGYKQIFPVLRAIIGRGHVAAPIIGIASSGWDVDGDYATPGRAYA